MSSVKKPKRGLLVFRRVQTIFSNCRGVKDHLKNLWGKRKGGGSKLYKTLDKDMEKRILNRLKTPIFKRTTFKGVNIFFNKSTGVLTNIFMEGLTILGGLGFLGLWTAS